MILRFFLYSLVIWPFLAKISLRPLMVVPAHFSYVIFQYGIHPVFSLLVSAGLVLGLLCSSRGVVKIWMHHRFYFSWGLLWCALLIGLGWLQVFFVPSEMSPLVQLGGLILTLSLIFFYGFLIPGLLPFSDFIKILSHVSKIFLFLSILFFFLSPSAVFKGSRFVGIFKHIPYMVTCAHLAILAFAFEWLKGGLRKKVEASCWILASLFCLFLTGTRSAVLAGFLFLIGVFFLQPARGPLQRMAKNLSLFLVIVFSLTIGPLVAQKAVHVVTGQDSFFMRKAQDGLASRWQEILNGIQIFSENPWLGHGLLYRFHNEEAEKGGQYSSFRDPHNLFLSAGVVGGWSLLVATFCSFLVLSLFVVKRLFDVDLSVQVLALYIFSHLPILAIYHIHLSIGGLADRMYWLLLGFLVFLNTKNKSYHREYQEVIR